MRAKILPGFILPFLFLFFFATVYSSSASAVAEETGTISGTVIDSAGVPASNVRVWVMRNIGGGAWTAAGSAYTDQNGNYSVEDLAAGTYTLEFSGDAYVTEHYDDQVDWDDSTHVAVVAGRETSGIDAVLVIAGSISGTVTDANGDPLSNIRVKVYQYTRWGWIPIFDDQTDQNGRYSLGRLGTDNYRVGFDDEIGIFAPEFYDDYMGFDSATDVPVVAGQATSGIDAVLVTAAAILRDSVAPTGSIKINGGAAYTRSKMVKLSLTGADTGGSGLDKMRFKNKDGAWSAWTNDANTKSWTLTTGNGTKRVYYRLEDRAGNASATYSDTIIYDSTKPTIKVYSPYVSTAQSKRPQFTVRWRGKDALSGIDSYTVKVKAANARTWTKLKANTTSTSLVFKGKMGRTYSFKALAKDKAGNAKWSAIRKTIVPYNEGANLRKRTGFNAYFKGFKSVYYLSSVRYSYKRGHTMIYKVPNAKSLGLITTKAKSRGKAKIYIDGNYIKTVDAYAKKTKARTLIYNKTFKKKKTHYIKIVNLGTPGRARFDIDGIAVGR